MRLIDADILIAELKESALHHCNNPREDSLLQRDRVIVRAQPTVEAIPISKGATNGDMIKALFPNCEVYEHKVKTNSKGDIVVGYDVFLYSHHPDNSRTGMGFGIKIYFDNMWWNAPYKENEDGNKSNDGQE